jgi:hypothetical protein
MVQVIARMPAEFPEASKGEPAISGASRVGNSAAGNPQGHSNPQGHNDEDAERAAAAGRRWRRRLMVANVVAWVLIILGIRLLFR